ncbi:MAG: YceI family protein [Acidimicrobiales bacterium]
MANDQPILKKRPVQILLVILVLLVVGAGFAVYRIINRDTPDEVNQDAAVAVVSGGSDTTASDGSTASGDSGSSEGIAGTWTVDTSIGEFNFEDATSSFVGFRIDEEFVGGVDTVAVGRTPTISGTLTIEGDTVTATELTATLDDLTTNDSRRDRAARRAMNTGEFPDATFSLTSPIELGPGAASGDAIEAEATGDLTINGVTQPATFSLTAQLVNNVVVVTGSTTVTFADFGVETPTAPIVAALDDFGIIEMQLFFTR